LPSKRMTMPRLIWVAGIAIKLLLILRIE